MTFGQQLRSWRKACDLTQRELADRVALHFTYICKVERDQAPVPSVESLHALATVLDVPAHEMFRAAKRLSTEYTKPELEALVVEMRMALKLWDKFADYAVGKNDLPVITMPLWYAVVLDEARTMTRSVLASLNEQEPR